MKIIHLPLIVAATACAVMFVRSPRVAQTLGVQSIEITYQPMPPPIQGGESARLAAGNAATAGSLYVFRVHLIKGGLVPPHTHTDTRYETVLSGTLYVCLTDTVAADKVRAFPAGSFFIMPAGTVHCSWAKDGDVTYDEAGIAPTTTTYLH